MFKICRNIKLIKWSISRHFPASVPTFGHLTMSVFAKQNIALPKLGFNEGDCFLSLWPCSQPSNPASWNSWGPHYSPMPGRPEAGTTSRPEPKCSVHTDAYGVYGISPEICHLNGEIETVMFGTFWNHQIWGVPYFSDNLVSFHVASTEHRWKKQTRLCSCLWAASTSACYSRVTGPHCWIKTSGSDWFTKHGSVAQVNRFCIKGPWL